MPYNPAGLFSLVASYFASPGASIRTEQHNPVFEDVASALSSVYLRDGRAPMTGDVNMNGFAINNVIAGSSPTSVATLAQAMPLGAIIDFAGGAAPAGWALCYGQAISRTTYAALFALFNTTYGPGDGSTTFNLPDLRGRVVAGYDAMGGASAGRLPGTNATSTGSQNYSLLLPNLPNVVPSFTGIATGVTVTSQQNNIPFNASGRPADGNNFSVTTAGGYSTITSTGTITPLGAVGSINGGNTQTAFSIVQPTMILNKIIRISYDV